MVWLFGGSLCFLVFGSLSYCGGSVCNVVLVVMVGLLGGSLLSGLVSGWFWFDGWLFCFVVLFALAGVLWLRRLVLCLVVGLL